MLQRNISFLVNQKLVLQLCNSGYDFHVLINPLSFSSLEAREGKKHDRSNNAEEWTKKRSFLAFYGGGGNEI